MVRGLFGSYVPVWGPRRGLKSHQLALCVPSVVIIVSLHKATERGGYIRERAKTRTYFVTVSKSFLYTHWFSPISSYAQIRHAYTMILRSGSALG